MQTYTHTVLLQHYPLAIMVYAAFSTKMLHITHIAQYMQHFHEKSDAVLPSGYWVICSIFVENAAYKAFDTLYAAF